MIALRLVRLIENNADDLAESLLQTFQTSVRTRNLNRVPEHELRDRCCDIYRNLSDWLLHKPNADVETRYRGVGERRALQRVPLADVTWGILLTKEHLWRFLERQGFLRGPLEIYGELELLRLLDQFFDRACCYVVEGYETHRLENQKAALPENGKPDRRLHHAAGSEGEAGLQ